VTLWLQVRDLGATLAEVSARGVAVVRPAQLEPWGLLEAWIDDPDGLRIHLVQVPGDHPLRLDQRRLTTGSGPP
jgi:predicted enzyme related to lactoylglutathione lyase